MLFDILMKLIFVATTENVDKAVKDFLYKVWKYDNTLLFHY